MTLLQAARDLLTSADACDPFALQYIALEELRAAVKEADTLPEVLPPEQSRTERYMREIRDELRELRLDRDYPPEAQVKFFPEVSDADRR